MDNHDDILLEVEAYCSQAGIKPSTLALRVMNNPRFFDRLKRRIDADAKAVAKLRAYMREQPAADGAASDLEKGVS